MAQSVLQYGNWTPGIFQPHSRSIGGILAQVTIDEQAEDDVQITEHPVEQGAPISDHAFKRPATLTVRAGWSASGKAPGQGNDLSAETGVYGLLLSWQAALMPFDVITGKRSFPNMLIERLSVMTDNHSEFALMATIVCRQVIIVGTQTTTVEGMSENGNDHDHPETTEPEKDSGDKSATNVGRPAVDPFDPEPAQSGPPDLPGPPAPPVRQEFQPPVRQEYQPAFTPTAQSVDYQRAVDGASPPNNPAIVTDLGGGQSQITARGTLP